MIIGKLFGKRTVESPSVPLNGVGIERILGVSSKATSGISVTPESSLGYPAVWRGVNIRAGTIGRLPLNVLRREGEGKQRDEKHPAFFLLREQPNSEQSAKAFKTLLEAHAILAGDGYALISRNSFGQPTALIPLPPEKVIPFRENGRLAYSIMTDTGMSVELPANILHICGLSWDGIKGLGLVDVLKESLGLGLAAQRYQSVFFKNGAAPMTVIELPGSLRNKEAIERFRAMWGKRHQGVDNSHQPALLENGAQLKPFSVSPQDAEMLQTREFEVKQIANAIGIPAYLLGDNTRTSFASLEVENRTFLRDMQDPMTNWESECARKLLSPEEKENRSHVIEFNKESIERPDITTQVNALQVQVNNGLLTLDEARNILNMPPVPNGLGQDFRIPLNMGILGEEPEGLEPPAEDSEPEKEELIQAAADALLFQLERAAKRISSDAEAKAKGRDKFDEWLEGFEEKHIDVVSNNTLKASRVLAKLMRKDLQEFHDNTLKMFFDTISSAYKKASECKIRELKPSVEEASDEVRKTLMKEWTWKDD